MNRFPQRRRARWWSFTITETVCVFFLLGIEFAAAASLLKFNIWLRDHLNRRLIAIELTKARLEWLRSIPYADLPYCAEPEVQLNADGRPDNRGGYYRTTTVGNEFMFTRDVTVRVRCNGKLSKPGLDVSLSTYILDNSTP
jgi:hypothetical protein